LRGLDTKLANACLDYLNYDRLEIKEVHKHMANGERDLQRWLKEYGIEPDEAADVGIQEAEHILCQLGVREVDLIVSKGFRT
jgi:hypothetical protein